MKWHCIVLPKILTHADESPQIANAFSNYLSITDTWASIIISFHPSSAFGTHRPLPNSQKRKQENQNLVTYKSWGGVWSAKPFSENYTFTKPVTGGSSLLKLFLWHLWHCLFIQEFQVAVTVSYACIYEWSNHKIRIRRKAYVYVPVIWVYETTLNNDSPCLY
jgi:hypothetical protein